MSLPPPSLFLNTCLHSLSIFFPPLLHLLWTSVDTFSSVSVNHKLVLEQPTGPPTRLVSLPAALWLSHPLPLLCHPSLYLCTSALSFLRTYFFVNLHFSRLQCPLLNSLASPLPLVFVSFGSLLLMRGLRYANVPLIPSISVFLSNLRAKPPNRVG